MIRQQESNCNHLSLSPRLGPGVRFVINTAKFEMGSPWMVAGNLLQLLKATVMVKVKAKTKKIEVKK